MPRGSLLAPQLILPISCPRPPSISLEQDSLHHFLFCKLFRPKQQEAEKPNQIAITPANSSRCLLFSPTKHARGTPFSSPHALYKRQKAIGLLSH